MFESMKKLVSGPLGKTDENARRIAAAIVLEKASLALTELFGDEAAAQMEPSVYRAGSLTITTTHAVWAQELKLRLPEAQRSINRQLGNQETVIKIVIR